MKLNPRSRGLRLGVRDNQLLISDRYQIHVLSTSGAETHRVNMPQGVWPYKAVAQLTSPEFVIMDGRHNQVVLVTEKGKMKHTLRYRDQEIFKQKDVVCHSRSIYVTDFDYHRVDELSVDGRHVRQMIREQGVRRPGRICVDDTGRLYLTQYGCVEQEVWVIKTQGTLLTQQTYINLSVTWCID